MIEKALGKDGSRVSDEDFARYVKLWKFIGNENKLDEWWQEAGSRLAFGNPCVMPGDSMVKDPSLRELLCRRSLIFKETQPPNGMRSSGGATTSAAPSSPLPPCHLRCAEQADNCRVACGGDFQCEARCAEVSLSCARICNR